MVRELRPSERDQAVIRLVAALGHATSRHIHELIFAPTTASHTPCDRTLTRLTKPDYDYLRRSEKRPVGGTKGGSAYYIYRLGRRGYWLVTEPDADPYRPRRQAVEHSLAIADVVVTLRQLERAGLPVHAIQLEPNCWADVGGVELKPDLFVDVTHPAAGRLRLWCEIDLATQGRKRIYQKCSMYLRAIEKADEDERRIWEPFPLVLFIAVDDERRKELDYLLAQLPEEDRAVFRVTTRELLPGQLS